MLRHKKASTHDRPNRQEVVTSLNGPVAELKGVSMVSQRKTVLDNVSLSLQPGEIVRLVGESGSGKTSIMRMLIGLEHPAAGTVELFGQDRAEMSKRERDQQIAQRAGIVFQQYPLLGNFSGAANIFRPHEQRGVHFTDDDRRRVAGLVGAVGLDIDQLRGRGSDLSGGEAQRISFVSALAHQPEVFFMDEPTSAQDPDKKAVMYGLLRDVVNDTGHPRSALIISHDQIPHGVVDREVRIDRGHIVPPNLLG